MPETNAPVAPAPSPIQESSSEGFNLGSMDDFLKSGEVAPVQPFDATPATPAALAPTGQAAALPPGVTIEKSPFAEEVVQVQSVPAGTQAAPPKGTPRDFTGLLPEEVQIFRDMGNASYAKLYPLYIEHKKLQSRAAEVERFAGEHEQLRKERDELTKTKFYEHEDAWRLDPEAKAIQSHVSQLAAEADYWTEQMALIEAGQPFRPIVLNDKGQPVTGELLQPTPQLKAQVQSALFKAHTLQTQQSERLGRLKSDFKTNYQGYVGKVEAMRKQWFGKYEAVIAPKRDAILKTLPVVSRSRPETALAVDCLVVLQYAIEKLNTKEAAAAGHQGNAAARAAQPPILPANPGTGGVGAGKSEEELAVEALNNMVRGPGASFG